MMTTAKAFGIDRRNSDPLMGDLRESDTVLPVAQEAPKKTKEELLEEYVAKYVAGEITESQLKVITKTLK